MNKIILDLCERRKYYADKAVAGRYLDSAGRKISFYYTELLSQDYLNTLLTSPQVCDDNVHAVVLCDKQKKLRVPLEVLTNVEVHNVQTVRRQLIANKFCPRFERLVGLEDKQLRAHFDALPILLTSDPMAQIYGFCVGDIVKIYRLDGSIYFRRVCAPL